jgi:hypothetical protein
MLVLLIAVELLQRLLLLLLSWLLFDSQLGSPPGSIVGHLACKNRPVHCSSGSSSQTAHYATTACYQDLQHGFQSYRPQGGSGAVPNHT